MRKLESICIFLLLTITLSAQQAPFITTWNISDDDLEITVYGYGENEGFHWNVNFGDGTVLNNVTGDVMHQYNSPGIYTVSISGDYRDLMIYHQDHEQLLSVEQWGNIQWEQLQFWYCNNLVINAIDAPDLSQATSLNKMFYGATSFNQSINHWDVSNINDMSYMFEGATSFNQPLNNWDVSNVTNMWGMFTRASSFNQPLDNWNVSSVEFMIEMFVRAEAFDQPIESWDVSNVRGMRAMFSGANSFNQALNNWVLSDILNMSSMFALASSFNQPLSNWNVSSVIYMDYMFFGATSFNQNINSWDVSNVRSLMGMFHTASSFNQSLNDWDVSGVTDMTEMFMNASSFNGSIGNWDVSNVLSMCGSPWGGMFEGATAFNQNINSWDVSNITYMKSMFREASLFNQPLNNWDVSNVTNLSGMFMDAISFNQSLNDWDISNVSNLGSMFEGASQFNQPLDNWSFVDTANLFRTFYYASSFDQDLSTWPIETNNLLDFLSYSSMSIKNFDKFLEARTLTSRTNGELGATDLEFCNVDAVNYLINNKGWSILGATLSSECNQIFGQVLYDETNDGCDENDIGINGIGIKITNSSSDFLTFSNDGNYSYKVYGNDFDVSVVSIPDYFNSNPTSANVIFTDSNTEEANFCITSDLEIEDLNIILLSINEARPGYVSKYQLVVENIGANPVANVAVSLVFDMDMQSFLSADATPNSTGNDNLIFEIEDLPRFGRKIINITMETFMPPIVEGGDVLSFTANVTPITNDYTPEDNTYVLEQIVVNSYDPNDKQVMQGEEIHIAEVDNYLDYLIRFQNIGTASAINVRILDTLHPKLDWSTIRPINASHDYRIEISNGNKVEFIFDDIQLPHEAGNEPESHGWVAYKIKPKSNVQVGDVISGDARIYFDYNPPIITNTVSTVIIDNIVGVADNSVLMDEIKIYPNPTDNILNIYLSERVKLEEVIIYGLQGQEILKLKERSIDVGNLSDGIYFIKIITDQGTVNRRFIKM